MNYIAAGEGCNGRTWDPIAGHFPSCGKHTMLHQSPPSSTTITYGFGFPITLTYICQDLVDYFIKIKTKIYNKSVRLFSRTYRREWD